MKKSHIILGATALLLILGGLYYYHSTAQASNSDDPKQAMIDTRAKAGAKKYEEQSKKELASKLLAEAEQARIEKEQLLGLTGSNEGLTQ